MKDIYEGVNKSDFKTIMPHISSKTLFLLFLREAGHLSSKDLGATLGDDKSPILICCAGLSLLSSLLIYPTNLFAETKSGKGPEIQLLNFGNMNTFEIPSISMQTALVDLPKLCTALAPALGIKDENQMMSIHNHLLRV